MKKSGADRLWPTGPRSVHYQAAVFAPPQAARFCVEAAKRLKDRRFEIEVYSVRTAGDAPREIVSALPSWGRIVALGAKSGLARGVQRLKNLVDLPVVALDTNRMGAEHVMEACLRNLE